MKVMQHFVFDKVQCRTEVDELKQLLLNNQELKENEDILPFFRIRPNICSLLLNYFPYIRSADLIAPEYSIDGHFRADLIVGSSVDSKYVLVEFEDGNPDSIFKRKRGKSKRDWSKRFESAYSQLTDWFWKLEDNRSTVNFITTFGSVTANFYGLIITGKDMNLIPEEEHRLKWRMDKTSIDNNHINVIPFDQLYKDMDYWLKRYHNV
ncbi:Shedu anti-phage system protein SduA domain-containing protein [Pantoea stewartii]|uniref:Shedu anti-phage system protein SduA domain-containing protein n=1 Tax=Pantoea stewartii TaxID=66269 RepID=UPI0013903480|nr:Shedu anti-phage system protein SduA domain-containing protein [Pantoea stewartii]